MQVHTNEEIKKISSDIKWAIIEIENYYNRKYSRTYKNPVVFLGRDCWILYALMQSKRESKYKIPVQYFMYSRLQLQDEATQKQWLKEVPAWSLVVDTGYIGTIFDDIMRFDATISGALLCSRRNYPQIIDSSRTANRIASNIESIPKLIGRSTTIDRRGIAVCPQDTKDVSEYILPLEETIEYNKLLVNELGLDPSWATYTGLKPEDRFKSEFNFVHYAQVAESRRFC